MRPTPNLSMRHPGRLAAAAASAAVAGWPVFPVRPHGKHPALADWEHAATTDCDQIAAWWRSAAWNIGISVGRAGLLVVDLDPSGGAAPSPGWAGVRGGYDMLTRLAADLDEPFPACTYTVATPSGGSHLYFRQPDGAQLRNTQGALGWRIDTRGHGGYVLAAGSSGADGQRYRVVRDGPVAELPRWLLHALTPPSPPAPTPRPSARAAGHQQSARLRAYLRAVVDGERHAVATATVGHRHTTLLRAARRLGHWVGSGALATDAARAALTDAARGYLDISGYTAQQIERDITDGLAYGARRPRYLDDQPPVDLQIRDP